MKRRNNYRYELKRGHEVVYRGITNNPERRAAEHEDDGKDFTHIRIVGPRVMRETAERWEEESLATYRKNHGGRNPDYNETDE